VASLPRARAAFVVIALLPQLARADAISVLPGNARPAGVR
jgi:hypothetical protein